MAITSPESCPLGKTYFFDSFSAQNPAKWSGTENIDSGFLYDTGSSWLTFSDNPAATIHDYVEIQLELTLKFKQDAYYAQDTSVFVLGDNTLSANYIALKWQQNDNVGNPAINFKYDLLLLSSGGSSVLLHRNDNDDIEGSIGVRLRIYADQVFGYVAGKYVGKTIIDSILVWDYALWAAVYGTEYAKIGAFYIVGTGLDETCDGPGEATRLDLETQSLNLKNENLAPDAHIDYDKLNLTGKISTADLAIGELHAPEDTTVLENKKIIYFEEFNSINTGATATSTNVSPTFTGSDTATSASEDEGYLIDTPKNYVTILDNSTKGSINDGSGNVVYGRLTEVLDVWTLSYYSSVASVETVYEFTDDTVIDIFVPNRTNLNDMSEDVLSQGGAGADGGSGGLIELDEHINSITAHPAANITVAFTPSNYTPSEAKVESHLDAIDTLFASIGGDAPLGTPSDGDYTDGLLDFTTLTQINDAVDGLNEVLSEIVPEPPVSLAGTDLQIFGGTTVKYSGYLSDGNAFYEGSAGDSVSYIINDATFNLETLSTTFNWADLGILKVQVNGVQVDLFDLESAFIEGERDGSQSYPPQSGVGGFITVMAVAKYNDFKKWQKGTARVNIVPGDLRQGYNYIKLIHELASGDQETNLWKLFYDDDSGAIPTVNTPLLTEANLISSKYLSGVQYYTVTDQLYLNVNGSDLFDNVYVQNPMQYTMPGISTSNISISDPSISPALSVPPVIGETAGVVNKIVTIAQANTLTNNLRITVIPVSPYGSHSSQISVSNNMLLNTYGNYATDLVENFVDENYRLPDNDGSAYPNNYDVIPGSTTGNWTSSVVLSNGSGESQIFNGILLYPSIDFTSGYFPAQSANYSSFTSDKYYLRSFYQALAISSGTLTFTGLTLSDIEAAGDAKVEIKLPSQTGWLDLGKPYDFGTFTGIDGDGCRTSASGSDFGWTSGSFSTAASGYMIIVRITIKDVVTPVTCTYIELT
jgi:hypothetical protein